MIPGEGGSDDIFADDSRVHTATGGEGGIGLEERVVEGTVRTRGIKVDPAESGCLFFRGNSIAIGKKEFGLAQDLGGNVVGRRGGGKCELKVGRDVAQRFLLWPGQWDCDQGHACGCVLHEFMFVPFDYGIDGCVWIYCIYSVMERRYCVGQRWGKRVVCPTRWG